MSTTVDKPVTQKSWPVPSPVAAKTSAAPAAKPAALAKASVVRTARLAVKAATKVPPKDAAKPVSRPVAKPVIKPVTKEKAVSDVGKSAKQKKPKLVRDSFTIPKAEYSVLEELKQRAATLAQPAKKSELLRAGIKALATMADSALRAALKAVPAIKAGRPKH